MSYSRGPRSRGGGPGGRGGGPGGRGASPRGPSQRHNETRPIKGESEFYTRPDYVTKGRDVPVVSNLVKLNIKNTSTVVYHYDVDISGIGPRNEKSKLTNIDDWVAFQFYERDAPDEQKFANFVYSVRDEASNQGITISEPSVVETLMFREADQRVRSVINELKPQFVLFVQPENEVFRSLVKDLCKAGRKRPIPSQFINTAEYEISPDALKSKIVRKFTGEKELSKQLNRRVIDALVKQETESGDLFRAADGSVILPAFDGKKNLFVSQPIEEIGTTTGVSVSRTVRIRNDETREGYTEHTVTIQLTGDVDAETEISWQSIRDYYEGRSAEFPKKVITVVNTIMRSGLLRNRFEVGANSMYANNVQRRDLGKGVGHAVGHFQSARPVAAGLAMVVDRTATAFAHNVSAMDFVGMIIQRRDQKPTLQDLMNLMRRDSRDREEVEKELKKYHFYTTYTGRKIIKKNFFALSDKPASAIEFPTENGMVKVVDYFKNKYNIKLDYPQLPCMDFGNYNNSEFIPIELCTLVDDQHVRGHLRPEQNREFIKATAIPPQQRFNDIGNAVSTIKNESGDYLSEFDIDMDVTPITATSKVIEPPSLIYGLENGSPKIVRPRDGSWNLIDIKLAVPTNFIQNWVAFSFYENRPVNPQTLNDFARSLAQMAGKMGLNLPRPLHMETLSLNGAGQRLKSVITEKKPNFVLFLQTENDLFRARVKQMCEVSLKDLNGIGVFSQCILPRVYSKVNGQTLANIVLKINAKCGGINHKLLNKPKPLTKPGVIIIGADVTHDVPVNAYQSSLIASTGIERFQASIAAVVGTTDSDFFKYYTEVRVQSREREEMISDFESMFVGITKNYYMKNKGLPNTIIYYRDGVSEGQFRIVLDSEIAQMERAFERIRNVLKLQQAYKPKVTFIVAQKRHHIRFKPQNPQDGVGRMGNVPPGMVVDTNVTDARDFDFFLNSHAGIQGLNRPTHYYVLRDDSKFSADDLTEMTYHLCHTYGKATKAVSIPSPVFYAHLACERSREHISTYMSPAGEKKAKQMLSYAQRDDLLKKCFQQMNAGIQVSPRMKEFMYYL